jgi:hypothetical protein
MSSVSQSNPDLLRSGLRALKPSLSCADFYILSGAYATLLTSGPAGITNCPAARRAAGPIVYSHRTASQIEPAPQILRAHVQNYNQLQLKIDVTTKMVGRDRPEDP